MAIITISREEGSLSREIAAGIAEKYKWAFVDKAIIEKELEQRYGMAPENFNRFDEKKPTVMGNFSHGFEKYYNYFKLYILEKVLENDGCVILGRGCSFLLRNIPGVLRVRLIASQETRVVRIMEEYDCDSRYAKKIIHQSDHERNRFHRFYFNESWSDPLFYDIVINTDNLGAESVNRMVSSAVESFIKENTDVSAEPVLQDHIIAQQIMNRILYTENLPVHLLDVNVKNRDVTLNGSVAVENIIKQCESIARQIPGVESVRNRIVFIGQYHPVS